MTPTPVLEAIARTAARLCEAHDALIHQVEGNTLRLVAKYGRLRAARGIGDTFPLVGGWVGGRAVLDRRTVHVRDLTRARDFPQSSADARVTKIRTILAMPLLRQRAAIGVIVIRRTTVRPFTAKQIALLKTFADQAAIAIENSRLSQELAGRNHDLSEALEQQTATSEILRVISSSPTDVQPTLDALAAAARRLCGAMDASVALRKADTWVTCAHDGPLPVSSDPRPLDRSSMIGRAILDGCIVHFPRLSEVDPQEFPLAIAIARQHGSGAGLVAPMLHDGVAVGAIGLRRGQEGAFTPRQIALLQTFADQAVIAIENVRLFTELEARNRELTRSLEQQTVTSEILRVISRSPTDTQPVFDTIAHNAVRLCGASHGGVYLFDGELVHSVANEGSTPEQLERWRRTFPRPLSHAGVSSVTIRTRDVVRIPDVEATPGFDLPDEVLASLRARGSRSLLSVPMLRQREIIGAISIAHPDVAAFSDTHVELLRTFADQAVIAIENVRLFTELERRNRDLSETLEQQTATGEILRVISTSPTDARPVFAAVAASAARLCDAFDGAIHLLEGDTLRLVAHHGPIPPDDVVPLRGTVGGRIIHERAVMHIADLQAEATEYPQSAAFARQGGFRTLLGIPLLRGDEAIGNITIRRIEVRPFTERQVELLKTFADQAVIAIENVRLFTELESRNRELRVSLEQQTATSELLKVIGRSAFDLQPVFETLAENAVRLCGATQGLIWRFDGQVLRPAVTHNLTAENSEFLGRNPIAPGRGSAAGRAAAERRIIHIHDVQTDPEYSYGAGQLLPYRTLLAIPMLRADELLGVIVIQRDDKVLPFTDNQIALLETFADQAAIAIENVRLFTELQARNRALTEALDQKTATAEILRVISSSPNDVQPVFDTILAAAARLCEAHRGALLLVNDGALETAAELGAPSGLSAVRQTPFRPDPHSPALIARVFFERRAMSRPDLVNSPAYQAGEPRAVAAVEAGSRSMLAVPLLKDDALVGMITIHRPETGPFSGEHVSLLSTFADQAVIAIENVRLFKELESRNRELRVALDQQTATADILRVISRSPTDVQPVFQAIVDSAARLLRGNSGVLSRIAGDQIELAAFTRTDDAGDALLASMFPISLRSSGSEVRPIRDQVIGEHIPYNVADVENDPRVGERGRANARARGYRSQLVVPMLRHDEPLGTIAVTRSGPGAFSDEEIALLTTFADQAVIAIENVRLFKELEARNRDLTESLEQQTATAEILRVISSSPTDVQPVLDAVAENAARLCSASDAVIHRVDGEVLWTAAHYGPVPLTPQIASGEAGLPIDRETVTARAVVDRRTIHVHDLFAEDEAEYPAGRMYGRLLGVRSILATPLLREDTPLGVIAIRRTEVRPFTDKQIELLQTFADQAVIAIENVRLFKELEARNRDLTESLEQQTATSEILRVISSSPTQIQPVLDALAESAASLCRSVDCNIFLLDGDRLALGARHGPPGGEVVGEFAIPLVRGTLGGRTVLERRTVHVADLLAETDEFPLAQQNARRFGFRTMLSVPLIREGAALGVIQLRRTEVNPFTDRQAELLQTFADQAVIAIENVRLFDEVQARTREVSKALEYRTATSDVLNVISRSPTDVQPVFDMIAESAARLCEAQYCFVYRFEDQLLHFVAHHGLTAEVLEINRRAYPAQPSRKTVAARAVLERSVVQVPDVDADPDYALGAMAVAGGYRSAAAVPIVRDGVPIGSIAVTRAQAGLLPDRQIELLKTFADQAVIAIENVRLFKELQARNRDLSETLDQQTATSDILRVISSSPTAVQPVFDAVAESASRLCEASDAVIFHRTDDRFLLVAHHGSIGTIEELSLSRGNAAGRTVLDGHTVHVADMQSETVEFPESRANALLMGFHTILSIPFMREGVAIGVVALRRTEVRLFTDRQVALLQTFADQAVIAIENVRLFKELKARTDQLTRSVDELTALGEVSRALSSTLDLETVLNTIVARASQLAGSNACSVYEYDEATEDFHWRASANLDEEVAVVARRTPIGSGGSAQARMVVTRQPVQIADIRTEETYGSPLRDVLLRTGVRAVLAVPLLRDDRLVGGLTVNRKTPGEFSPETVELLKTFANQSALAINNARLFREIEDKSRQVEIASRHKSQFLANMSHELRTPLNAILGYTELIADSIYGEVPERMREVLERVDKSGRHLLGLINDILDLSKIEAGQLTLALTPYSMDGVAQTVATQIGGLAADKQLGFELVLAEDVPIGQGDERRLTQVLLNLVGNAIKFTDVGKVVVHVATSEDHYVVSVTDTGPGIAEGDREKIFEEFQQADTTRAKAKGGTGLGLAISRRIVEMHGGRLWVESTLGEGATFSFTVPIRVERQVDVAARRSSS